MNHKRKRTKRQRAGCLMCKPWKANGESKQDHFTPGEKRKLQEDIHDVDSVQQAIHEADVVDDVYPD